MWHLYSLLTANVQKKCNMQMQISAINMNWQWKIFLAKRMKADVRGKDNELHCMAFIGADNHYCIHLFEFPRLIRLFFTLF